MAKICILYEHLCLVFLTLAQTKSKPFQSLLMFSLVEYFANFIHLYSIDKKKVKNDILEQVPNECLEMQC